MTKKIKLGLKENWQQFTLLVIVNAFVGGMVGIERSILPQLAEQDFGMVASQAAFSFIIAFGLSKAFANYFTGRLSARFGKKRLLILGWLIGLPVPLILMNASEWSYIVAANVLLGFNQGFAWSATVIMKIDLVGEKQRGLAMGLNEFAGYLSVALAAFSAGWIATHFGLRPYPFYLGLAFATIGLIVSVVWVRDTHIHVQTEAVESPLPRLKKAFLDTTWRHPDLASVTQAGFFNNLNDGMLWAVLPLILAQKGFDLVTISSIVAVYPAVWGISQLITGRFSDFICKKDLLESGLMLQSIALILFLFSNSMAAFIGASALLGFGTAMVYPTFLASIAENTHPLDRSAALGVFRSWRDSGYAVGALLAAVVTGGFSLSASIAVASSLTLFSALWLGHRMHCTRGAVKLITWLSHKFKIQTTHFFIFSETKKLSKYV